MPVPDGADGVARAVNDRGQIVGDVTTIVDFSTPFLDDVVLWTLPQRR